MPVRIKICGITRPEDGQAAAQLGADAIGLVFYPKSPRHVSLEQARAIVATLPPLVTVVALFVDPEPDDVYSVLAAVPIDVLQFTGERKPGFLPAVSTPLPESRARSARPGFATIRACPHRGAWFTHRCLCAGRARRDRGHLRLALLPDTLPLPLILSGGPGAGQYCPGHSRHPPSRRGRLQRRGSQQRHQGRCPHGGIYCRSSECIRMTFPTHKATLGATAALMWPKP